MLTRVLYIDIIAMRWFLMTNKKQKSHELAPSNWVSKSNALNEVRNNRMTISQIRLFTIYLSKINPKNIASREVTFKLEEYAKVMQFKKANTTRLMRSAEDLLGLTVTYWDKTGEYSSDGLRGFVICQIFKRFKFYKNDDGEWLVSIDCHDDVIKLMFDLQKYYFKYQLWNALQLTSPNQQRMYEILKQYEFAGAREVSIKDLRELLGLKPEEYSLWQNFKVRVLEASQEALANYTDIKFTWEAAGKRGRGGKINKLKFYIEKNDNYVRQLTFDDYLLEQVQPALEEGLEEFERPEDDCGDEATQRFNERISFFGEACGNEFSKEEIVVLFNKVRQHEPQLIYDDIQLYHYLNDRYNEMLRQDKKSPRRNRFGYVKSLVGNEI